MTFVTKHGLATPVRFWAKVDRPNGPLDPGPCWTWTGGTYTQGYGVFKLDGRSVRVHVWAYEWFYDEPVTHMLDHWCHDPATCPGGFGCPHRRCVNPWHLRDVPQAINNSEHHAWNNQPVCVNGHVRAEVGWYVTNDGRRQCRACAADQQKRYKARKRQGLVPKRLARP